MEESIQNSENTKTSETSDSPVAVASTSETIQNINPSEINETRNTPEAVHATEANQTIDTAHTTNTLQTVQQTSTLETDQTRNISETEYTRNTSHDQITPQTVQTRSQRIQCTQRCKYGCGREGTLYFCCECILYILVTRNDILSNPRGIQALNARAIDIFSQEYNPRINIFLENMFRYKNSCPHPLRISQDSASAIDNSRQGKRKKNDTVESCSRTRLFQQKHSCSHSELLTLNVSPSINQENPPNSPIITQNVASNLDTSHSSEISLVDVLNISDTSSTETAAPNDSRIDAIQTSDAISTRNESRDLAGSEADVSHTLNASQSLSNADNSRDSSFDCTSSNTSYPSNPDDDLQALNVEESTANIPSTVQNSPPSSPPRICERCERMRKEIFVMVYFRDSNPGQEYEILNAKRIVQHDIENINFGTRVFVEFGNTRAKGLVIIVSRSYEYLYLNFDLLVEMHRKNLDLQQHRQRSQNSPNSPNSSYTEVLVRGQWVRRLVRPKADQAVQTDAQPSRQAELEALQERYTTLVQQCKNVAVFIGDIKQFATDALFSFCDYRLQTQRTISGHGETPRSVSSESSSPSSDSRHFRPIHRDPANMHGDDYYTDSTDPDEFGEPMEGPYPQRQYPGDVPQQLYRNGQNG